MVNFNFNLQKVLDIRNIREEKAQNRLWQARQQMRETENRLTELNRLQDRLYNIARSGEDMSVNELLRAREYLHFHRRKISKTESELAEHREEVEDRKEEFIEKRRQKRVLENLREQKYREYCQDLLQKEQKTLDDIAQRCQVEEAGGLK